MGLHVTNAARTGVAATSSAAMVPVAVGTVLACTGLYARPRRGGMTSSDGRCCCRDFAMGVMALSVDELASEAGKREEEDEEGGVGVSEAHRAQPARKRYVKGMSR